MISSPMFSNSKGLKVSLRHRKYENIKSQKKKNYKRKFSLPSSSIFSPSGMSEHHVQAVTAAYDVRADSSIESTKHIRKLHFSGKKIVK